MSKSNKKLKYISSRTICLFSNSNKAFKTKTANPIPNPLTSKVGFLIVVNWPNNKLHIYEIVSSNKYKETNQKDLIT